MTVNFLTATTPARFPQLELNRAERILCSGASVARAVARLEGRSKHFDTILV
jgi:hypothetical protein